MILMKLLKLKVQQKQGTSVKILPTGSLFWLFGGARKSGARRSGTRESDTRESGARLSDARLSGARESGAREFGVRESPRH